MKTGLAVHLDSAVTHRGFDVGKETAAGRLEQFMSQNPI